jgi:hypothetical protein
MKYEAGELYEALMKQQEQTTGALHEHERGFLR